MMPSLRRGNAITLLSGSHEFFPALLAAIAAAREEIYLETYIFADDAIGQRVATALAAAALRDVRVHVLVDGFGAREFADGLGRTLETAGVEVLVYRREIAPWTLRRHRLRRLHRKLAMIDQRYAFVGGINIDDNERDIAATTAGAAPSYLDYAVRVEGPLIIDIHAAIVHLWGMVRWASLRQRQKRKHLTLDHVIPCGDISARFLIRDNFRHRRTIETAYLRAIHTSRCEVLIACAYFFPSRPFQQALLAAAQRGVQVTLLLQGDSDHLLWQYAARYLYEKLLVHGVQVIEYQAGKLHAKVAVIDGEWATIGSSNIDPFSLLLAREANVEVNSPALAHSLRRQLQTAIEHGGLRVRADDLQQRNWWAHTLYRLSYTLVRVLIGISRYGGKTYRE